MPGLFFNSGIDKGFENDLARMNAQMNNFATNTVDQTDKIDSSFKGMAKTISGTVAVLALGAAGKELLNFTKDLETALIEVATVSGVVTNDFQGYQEALIALSTQGSQSALELTNAFYDIVSAGHDGEAGLTLLAAAQKASTAGFVDVGVAADGLTTVLNAWGKSANEAGLVSDIFFKTVERGKTTFPELASNIAKVAPFASSMGVSFEDISAAVATITKQGTPTSEAFTQIRGALVAMSEQLGTAFFETNNLQDGFEALAKKSAESGKTIKEVTGTVEGALAVLGTTGKNALVAASDIEVLNNALGATEIAAAKVRETTDQQIKQLKNNILAAFTPLGSELNKVIGKIAENLNDAFASGNAQEFLKILLQLTKVFVAYKVATIAQNQVDNLRKNILLRNINLQEAMRLEYALSGNTATASAQRMAVANKVLANSFRSLSAAFTSNPIGLLVTGLTIAIPLIKKFTASQREMAKFSNDIATSIKEEKKGVNELFEELKKVNPESERAKKIREDLNELYPDLLKQYDLEKGGLVEIEKAQIAVNKEIVRSIALKKTEEKRKEADEKFNKAIVKYSSRFISGLREFASEGELDALFAGVVDQLNAGGFEVDEAAKNIAKKLGLGPGNDVLFAQAYNDLITKNIQGIADESAKLGNSIDYVNKYLKDYYGILNDGAAKPDEGGGLVVDPNTIIITELTPAEKAALKEKAAKEAKEFAEARRVEDSKQLEISNQQRINETLKQFQDGILLEKEYNIKKLENDLIYLKQKSLLTTEELEKLKIKEAEIIAEAELKKAKENDPLAALELTYKSELLLLKKQFVGKANLKKKYDIELLKAEKKYLEEKIKLTSNEADKIELENRLLAVDEAINYQIEETRIAERTRVNIIEDANREILALEKKLQGDITIMEAEELKDRIAEQQAIIRGQQKYTGDSTDTTSLTKDIQEALTISTDAFAQMGDGLANELASLSVNISNAFSAINSDTASSSEKITGLISLIIQAGNIINDAIQDSYADEAAALDMVNKGTADRISAEAELNSLLRDRANLELNASAFLDPNYKDVYAQATKAVIDSQKTITSSLEGLQKGLVLSAEGQGESWLGLNKAAKTYSFTIDQILNGWADLNKTTVTGTIANIIDPLDIFGTAAESDAVIDSYNKVKAGINAALQSMGKTAQDVAKFSAQEWSDFYSILDSGGYIVEEGTKQLVSALKEAQSEYQAALEQMKEVITVIAGRLGNDLGDTLVNSIQNGTDALDGFKDSLNDVFIEMAKAEVNSIFFQGLFDNLQAEMAASMEGGDQDWQDDLIRFYDQLPASIKGAEEFLRNFDLKLHDLGFEGLKIAPKENAADEALSAAGQIRQAITEETGSQLVGRMGAIMLSNERIAQFSEDSLDLAIENLITLNKIRENTDYLPAIAENTRKTAERLESI